MRLSANFYLSEFITSQTATRRGIDNYPSDEKIDYIQDLCDNILEPVREWAQSPVVISSGYRCPALNAAVGGSPHSQHTLGQAADIEIPGVDNCDLCRWIEDNLVFDQLILEFHDHNLNPNSGWVHVSFNRDDNKGECLTATRLSNGRVIYTKGFPWWDK